MDQLSARSELVAALEALEAATTPAERLKAARAYLEVNPRVTEQVMRIAVEEAAAGRELALGGAGVAAAGREAGRGAERLVRDVLSHVKRKPVH
jgi:hypothetical protein